MAVRKRTRARVAPEPNPLVVAPIRPNASLAEFAREWLKARPVRTRAADTQRLRDHVLPLLGTRRLRDVSAEDVAQMVRQTLAKKGMNVKSARNAYGVLAELLGDVLGRGLLSEDPRTLPADIWPVEAAGPAPRFSLEEVHALTHDERLDADQRLFNRLAFYSGLESAEVCTLRFEDWQQRCKGPLHPELCAAVQAWRESGFERVFGRAPSDQDWLVPRRSDVAQPHTEGSSFKAFRRACVTLKMKTRSPRAVLATFEALAPGHEQP